jgi:hypothetical protein
MPQKFAEVLAVTLVEKLFLSSTGTGAGVPNYTLVLSRVSRPSRGMPPIKEKTSSYDRTQAYTGHAFRL